MTIGGRMRSERQILIAQGERGSGELWLLQVMLVFCCTRKMIRAFPKNLLWRFKKQCRASSVWDLQPYFWTVMTAIASLRGQKANSCDLCMVGLLLSSIYLQLSEKEAKGYQGSTLMCTDELISTPTSWMCLHVPVCNEQIFVDGKEQKTSGWILLTRKQWTLPCLCSVSHDNSLTCPQAHLPSLHTNIWTSDCVHCYQIGYVETPYLSAVPVIWDKCREITNTPITEEWVVVLINRHRKHVPAPQWSEMHRTPQGLELRSFTETVVLALFHTSYLFSTLNSFSGLIGRKIGIQARDCHAEFQIHFKSVSPLGLKLNRFSRYLPAVKHCIDPSGNQATFNSQ